MHETNENNSSKYDQWRLFVQNALGHEEHYHGESGFDELVVGNWLHLERLDEKIWWLSVGDARIMVQLADSATPEVDVIRGYYADINGTTKEHNI